MEIQRPLAIFVGLGHGIERLFGLGDLVLGGLFGRRVIGGVDDVLADADQAAAHRQVGQDVGVIADIGNGGRGGLQRVEIGLAAGFDHPRIGLHGGVQGQRRDHHAAALDHLRHGLEDAAMQGIVEMLGLQKGAGALHRPVVGQDRAQQRLFDVDIVRDVAISFLFHCALDTSSAIRRATIAGPTTRGQAINRGAGLRATGMAIRSQARGRCDASLSRPSGRVEKNDYSAAIQAA